ncbi:MAG TPA: hypothetical protein VLB44_25535 [Kofleriaceae bacterium]|nr:hypothetical protein [Kofleriaceae bacterium]
MRIATRCRSVDQFVAMSARYIDGSSLFVATLVTREVALDLEFVVLLADGTPVLRGRAVVREAWSTADNPFRLPGLLLGVRMLTPRSKEVFDRIRGAAGRAATHRRVAQPSEVGTKSEPSFDADAAFGVIETTLVGPPLSNAPRIEPSRQDQAQAETSMSDVDGGSVPHEALVQPLGRRDTRPVHRHDPGAIRIPTIPPAVRSPSPAPMTIVIPDSTKPLTRSWPVVPTAPVQRPAPVPVIEIPDRSPDVDASPADAPTSVPDPNSLSDGTVEEPASAVISTRRCLPPPAESFTPRALEHEELVQTWRLPGRPPTTGAASEPRSLSAPRRGAVTGKRAFKRFALALVAIAVAAVGVLYVPAEAALRSTVAEQAATKLVSDVRATDVPPAGCEKPTKDLPAQAVLEIDGKMYIIQVVATPVNESQEVAKRGR